MKYPKGNWEQDGVQLRVSVPKAILFIMEMQQLKFIDISSIQENQNIWLMRKILLKIQVWPITILQYIQSLVKFIKQQLRLTVWIFLKTTSVSLILAKVSLN